MVQRAAQQLELPNGEQAPRMDERSPELAKVFSALAANYRKTLDDYRTVHNLFGDILKSQEGILKSLEEAAAFFTADAPAPEPVAEKPSEPPPKPRPKALRAAPGTNVFARVAAAHGIKKRPPPPPDDGWRRIVAKYAGKCRDCEELHEPGDDIFYEIDTKRVVCEACFAHEHDVR